MALSQLPRTDEGQRICQVVKLKPEHADEYIRLHADVWPAVLDALRKANFVDYSVHYFAELGLLIAHMRYLGTDLAADAAGIRESEDTRRWWKVGVGVDCGSH
ncbi:hypothetical protein VHUM_04254 [Vanrija humicola]|uniref:L-rhamnose mutarotase n=1 Tax=Vanrija humicola TaxID=5417 RepID=A0A7D8V2A7_VANHU|nr:hypothetical protein VHUM_04254 [Vanrija humicola]